MNPQRNGSTRQWRRKRARILAASDICGICGQPGADAVDHIIPWVHTQDDSDGNLQPVHHHVEPKCNMRKGDKLIAPIVKRSGALS